MMVGGRINLGGASRFETFERLLNATLFNEVNEWTTVGLEVNHAIGNRGRSQTILVPQIHRELGEHWELQSGLGFGVFDAGSEQSFILRLIYAR